MRSWMCGVLAALAVAAAVAAGAPVAGSEDNGVGLTPALGWSSWSFIRHNPTAANIEAQADAMKSSGLAAAGFQYVNVDDFWYQCPGSQGPNVDQYGRWVTDQAKFPPSGSTDGIQVVADYVHSLGLQFGLYVTPGISHQAVVQNTAIEGTPYHADDIATSTAEKNYNCKGMVGIDYAKPGAQAFVDSWANEFASWGVDYVKIDGVGTSDIPDVQAWSAALRQTGRPIHLELSNSLSISAASTWEQYSNGWRTGGDVECYCGTNGSSYPLTNWSHVSSRFNQVAAWQPYGGPGGFNDYDSLELGNGANDGLTPDERRTQMSLWSLAASPLILGTDLTNLDPTDLGYLTNTAVLAVDQDGIDASRISNTSTSQTFAKTEPNGDVIVGLFNTTTQPEAISTSASALGMPSGSDYALDDLWTHATTETTGAIGANVPAHGVALFRVTDLDNPTQAPPNATLALDVPSPLTAGQPATATESFTDNGDLAAKKVQLGLQVPSGWSATATSPTSFAAVETGQTVQATFQVVAPAPAGVFQTDTLTGTASYTYGAGKTTIGLSTNRSVTTSSPVQPPYLTFSSATDAPAAFGQSGDQFGISGAGADLWSNSDSYSTIYLHGAVGTTSTIQTELVSQQNLTGYGKTGIIVRNDMTGSGTTPEGVILFASPSGGMQLEWDSNGGTHIDAVTPPNGTIAQKVPVWLRLVRSGSTYTGYYSTDGNAWSLVGSANVPAQAGTQDAGMFVTSHAAGSPAQVVFDGFDLAAGAQGPGAISYEAESSANTLAGGAKVATCSACSGGQKVGYVGNGGTLTFNGVTVPSAGVYQVTIAYLDGSTTGRQATVSVNGGTAQTFSFAPTGSFDTVGTQTVTLQLAAGANRILFANPSDYAPDFDRIVVAASPS